MAGVSVLLGVGFKGQLEVECGQSGSLIFQAPLAVLYREIANSTSKKGRVGVYFGEPIWTLSDFSDIDKSPQSEKIEGFIVLENVQVQPDPLYTVWMKRGHKKKDEKHYSYEWFTCRV